ncbi:MAG: hypothetical protein ACK4YO_02835, partial [Candidatus Altarchaeaceae archaeon]
MNHKTIKKRNEASLFIILVSTVLLINFANALCVSAGCCDLCENYVNDSANITVNFPIIVVNKTVIPEKFEQGDLVKFHIEVMNLGNA